MIILKVPVNFKIKFGKLFLKITIENFIKCSVIRKCQQSSRIKRVQPIAGLSKLLKKTRKPS